MLLITIASFLFLYTGLSQDFISVISGIIVCISAFSGGMSAGLNSHVTGWIYGGASAILFVCVLLICNIILNLGIEGYYKLLLALATSSFFGCLGGVVGINLKPKRFKRQKH
jgi:putative membrane protein (TIGR04086 family)